MQTDLIIADWNDATENLCEVNALNFIEKRIFNSVLISCLICLCCMQAATPVFSESSKHEGGSAQNSDDREEPVRQVLSKIGTAVSAGNAVGLAELWTEDAVLIDERGEETQGRKALQEKFTGSLGEPGSATVGLHPGKISFPAANLALIVGSVSRKSRDIDLPTARFSMLLEKQGSTWLVKQATETPILETIPADHLKELEWLIGTWRIDMPDNKARVEIEWGSGRNFIISKNLRNRNGVPEVDTQIIGWDPRKKEIVSWHFGNHGGFGYGKWTRQEDRWVVEFAGVGHRGNSTRATDFFIQKNSNEFTWQATDQSSDGVPVADGELVTVQKVK